jgi:5-methylcytosine-specific restriction endonuclease McrA
MPEKSKEQKVWEKAKIIPGKDPAQYRQDPYGNVMNRAQYGQNTSQGWDIDHIYPESKGGSDSIQNLQALNTKVNRAKGDSLVKRSRHSKNNK